MFSRGFNDKYILYGMRVLAASSITEKELKKFLMWGVNSTSEIYIYFEVESAGIVRSCYFFIDTAKESLFLNYFESS